MSPYITFLNLSSFKMQSNSLQYLIRIHVLRFLWSSFLIISWFLSIPSFLSLHHLIKRWWKVCHWYLVNYCIASLMRLYLHLTRWQHLIVVETSTHVNLLCPSTHCFTVCVIVSLALWNSSTILSERLVLFMRLLVYLGVGVRLCYGVLLVAYSHSLNCCNYLHVFCNVLTI
jgi:hypothetical protein